MSEKYTLPKSDSPKMFDAIAGRYDFLNRLLSLGQDVCWRAQLRKLLPHGDKMHILDLATGTADVLVTLTQNNIDIAQAIGIDPSENMLKVGRIKIEKAGLSDKVILHCGDAQKLPFLEDSFDCVTISFGIRNVPDLRLGLLEMYRVAKKGGQVMILEFSTPSNILLAGGHWLYLNTIVPFFGFLFSGNFKAYRYLSQTIQDFPYGDRFCKILKQFGFLDIKAYPLMGGVATIYVANK